MHYHHDHHSHTAPTENKGVMFTLGILLNIGFVLAEFAMGIYFSSMGLLSDAGHNLSDVGSLALSMVAFLLAQRQVSTNFTYGYRKATIHASLLNALILLVAVGGIGVECIQKLRHPTRVDGLPIIITAGVGILVNGATTLLFLKDKDKDLNVKGAYLHMLADTLVSVGVVISGIIIMFTGWAVLDPIIGLAIAIVILIAGWGMLTESLRLALDGIPGNIDMPEIQEHILANDNVEDIHHLHIWPISTTMNALTAHIVLKDINGLETTKTQLRSMLAKHGIAHSTFEIELSGTECAVASCH